MKNVPVWLMKAALTCSFLAIIFTATPSYAISPIGSPFVGIGGVISVMPEFEVSATSVGKNEAYTLTLPPAVRLDEKVGTGSWTYLGHGIRKKPSLKVWQAPIIIGLTETSVMGGGVGGIFTARQ